ncbi:hypothetical protein V502_04103 [Pseudogymnoascus sp. VKM F-4520 (FW-2644)]|nr:hypothetical protein V502_04103 [Pseudogymnoascus sp. VKM F-4520 (FW-2644)]
MTTNLVPNWLRIILSILSFLSFIPQLRLTWAKKDSSDVSLNYILLILISATEQFNIGFFFVASHSFDSDIFVHDPRNTGDWLNLAQLTVVWIMSLVLFALCLFYSHSPRSLKVSVVAVYISFLLISVVPTFIDAIDPAEPSQRIWISGILISVHTMYINPIVTMGIIWAFCAQRHKASALSTLGLATQAVVFSLVALSWTSRVRFIDDLHGVPPGVPLQRIFIFWYQVVGWATVDNAIFAMIQFVLFCLATHHKRRIADSFSLPEQEPLLGR